MAKTKVRRLRRVRITEDIDLLPASVTALSKVKEALDNDDDIDIRGFDVNGESYAFKGKGIVYLHVCLAVRLDNPPMRKRK